MVVSALVQWLLEKVTAGTLRPLPPFVFDTHGFLRVCKEFHPTANERSKVDDLIVDAFGYAAALIKATHDHETKAGTHRWL
jgi:hypothetical protein